MNYSLAQKSHLLIHNNWSNYNNVWFQASATKLVRTALLFAIMQRVAVIPYRRFGTDGLSRNVGEELPILSV